MSPWPAILCVCALLIGCDSGSPPPTQTPDTKATTPSGTASSSEEENWWQLPDDSHLEVFISPWPPTQGSSTLRVEVTEDDGEEKFRGTVQYRIVSTKESADAWIPLASAGKKDGNALFSAPVELRVGTYYVQFRVNEKDGFSVDRLDMKMDVKERKS